MPRSMSGRVVQDTGDGLVPAREVFGPREPLWEMLRVNCEVNKRRSRATSAGSR